LRESLQRPRPEILLQAGSCLEVLIGRLREARGALAAGAAPVEPGALEALCRDLRVAEALFHQAGAYYSAWGRLLLGALEMDTGYTASGHASPAPAANSLVLRG
jgi:hypothetical protein